MTRSIKATLATLLFAFIFVLSAQADKDTPISVNQLPHTAQSILKKSFSGVKVALAKKESDLIGKSYEVIFTNGDKIEFDGNGKWTDISCKKTSVPASLLPGAITNYVIQNYGRVRIVEIDRDRRGYSVQLSNGIELDFDKSFRLMNIDN